MATSMVGPSGLRISPLGRVEGDLDLRIAGHDRVVTDARTEAGMLHGFGIILKGKDPQARLVITPRICGICGGSHLYKAAYALFTAWRTHIPPMRRPLMRSLTSIRCGRKTAPRG